MLKEEANIVITAISKTRLSDILITMEVNDND
jgi:hypothetical protein